MPLSSEEQALFDHMRNMVPRWLTEGPNSKKEWLYAFAHILEAARLQGQLWIDLTYLDLAVGIELDQHAIDRGTSRQNGESDAALRERLRSISDAITDPALTAGVDQILDGTGQLADFRVQAYTKSGWTSELETYFTVSAGGPQTQLTFQTVNDGTNPATLVQTGNAAVLHYSAGVTTRAQAETLINASTIFRVKTSTASSASTLTANDVFGPKRFYLSRIVGLRRDRGFMHVSGSSTAFLSRGYRMTNHGRPMSYIIILPFGTTAATALSVGEYLRKNGPAGFLYIVERRLNP